MKISKIVLCIIKINNRWKYLKKDQMCFGNKLRYHWIKPHIKKNKCIINGIIK